MSRFCFGRPRFVSKILSQQPMLDDVQAGRGNRSRARLIARQEVPETAIGMKELVRDVRPPSLMCSYHVRDLKVSETGGAALHTPTSAHLAPEIAGDAVNFASLSARYLKLSPRAGRISKKPALCGLLDLGTTSRTVSLPATSWDYQKDERRVLISSCIVCSRGFRSMYSALIAIPRPCSMTSQSNSPLSEYSVIQAKPLPT